MLSRATKTGVLLALISTLAGCLNDSPDPTGPTVALYPKARTYQQEFSKILPGGTPVVPVHWEDPEEGSRDTELQKAVLAARHYLALSSYEYYHQPHPAALNPIRKAITTGTLREIILDHPLGDAPQSNFGRQLPVWFIVTHATQDGSQRVRVDYCSDVYWHATNRKGLNNTHPRSRFRGEMNSLWLLSSKSEDSGPEWRASEIALARTTPDVPEGALKECNAWTRKHTEPPPKLSPELTVP